MTGSRLRDCYPFESSCIAQPPIAHIIRVGYEQGSEDQAIRRTYTSYLAVHLPVGCFLLSLWWWPSLHHASLGSRSVWQKCRACTGDQVRIFCFVHTSSMFVKQEEDDGENEGRNRLWASRSRPGPGESRNRLRVTEPRYAPGISLSASHERQKCSLLAKRVGGRMDCVL